MKAPASGRLALDITAPGGVLSAKTNSVRFTTTDASPDIDLIYHRALDLRD